MLLLLILLPISSIVESIQLSTNGLVGEIRGGTDTMFSNFSLGGEGALTVGAWSSNTCELDLNGTVFVDVLIHFSVNNNSLIN